MTEQRWSEVELLYHAALERTGAQRGSFLSEACETDSDLRREVESLLERDGSADDLFESPAWTHIDDQESYVPGTRLGPYEIVELLGRGGMGEVYKAEDTRLKRLVAIKVLGQESREKSTFRFIEEARAASALNNPHIVQIHEFESNDDNDFLVMEFLPGKTLADVLATQRLSLRQVLDYAGQIVSALAAAHAARIVHRDIKPSNIMVSDTGNLKLLDFGIAKRVGMAAPADTGLSDGASPVASSVMGTASYMSPEQAQGKLVDARSDIFSIGAVLYEMLTGRRAFDGDSTAVILQRLIHESPPAIRDLNPNVSKALGRIVERCLQKDPGERFASGVELGAELDPVQRALVPRPLSLRLRMAIATLLLIAVGIAGLQYYHSSRARWVRNIALPQIRELIDKSEYVAAFDLIRTAQRHDPDDPLLRQYWSEISLPIQLRTTPPGATVSYKRYGDPKAAWHNLAVTPLAGVPVPAIAQVVLRIEKEGFEPAELAVLPLLLQNANIRLYQKGSIPVGMVPIPRSAPWAGPGARAPLPDYYIDKFEVNNVDYQKFVDAGGYRDAKYWRHPFMRGARAVPFVEAMAGFLDHTGRSGPATWEHGRHPKGQADYPVAGISWFEAAAYCEFAGKILPTASHWTKAAGLGIFSEVLLFSNFNGTGPAPVGSYHGLSPFGTYDLAGNVTEWLFNEADGGRAIFGGGWNQPAFIFNGRESRNPFSRGVAFGCRCALAPQGLPKETLAPLVSESTSLVNEKPVADEVFATFRRLYEYDHTPLEARTEAVDDSNPNYRLEKVSYRAAYENQRIPAHLYLPKTGKPPYQTVLWMPGGYAWMLPSSDSEVRSELFRFLLSTGRAVMHPVYWGHYERRDRNANGPNAFRDLVFRMAKDTFRSLDYLDSRQEIDSGKLAFFSVSNQLGPILLALDPRLKAAILVSSALVRGSDPAEVDPFHFASRVQVPVLMINGRYDFLAAPRRQEALFQMLGSPPRKKRHAVFDVGHVVNLDDIRREVLNWLDQELGSVGIEARGRIKTGIGGRDAPRGYPDRRPN